MRKAGWPCLSTETPCAETKNSSPMAQLQAWELQEPGLTSAPWDWPFGGSWRLPSSVSAAVRGLRRRDAALLCAGSVRGSGKSPGEGSRSQSFAAAVSGFTLPWEGAGTAFGLLLRLLGSLCCSRPQVSCCLARCLDFPSSPAPAGTPPPCAEGPCGVPPLSRLGTPGMKSAVSLVSGSDRSDGGEQRSYSPGSLTYP